MYACMYVCLDVNVTTIPAKALVSEPCYRGLVQPLSRDPSGTLREPIQSTEPIPASLLQEGPENRGEAWARVLRARYTPEHEALIWLLRRF